MSQPLRYLLRFCRWVQSVASVLARSLLSHDGDKLLWIALFVASVLHTSILNVVYMILLAVDVGGRVTAPFAVIHAAAVYVHPLYFIPDVSVQLGTNWDVYIGIPRSDASKSTLLAPVIVLLVSLLQLTLRNRYKLAQAERRRRAEHVRSETAGVLSAGARENTAPLLMEEGDRVDTLPLPTASTPHLFSEHLRVQSATTLPPDGTERISIPALVEPPTADDEEPPPAQLPALYRLFHNLFTVLGYAPHRALRSRSS